MTFTFSLSYFTVSGHEIDGFQRSAAKKQHKHEIFNESVDIIEKDKFDNNLLKQVASVDESGTKKDDDKHDITDETTEKILPILDENKIQMQEPIKHTPWNESANPPQDNDKYEYEWHE